MDDKEYFEWALKFIREKGEQAFKNLLKNRLKIDIEVPVSCYWKVHEVLNVNGQGLLSKQDHIEMFKRGVLKTKILAEKQNKIMDGYISALIAHGIGNQSAGQDLQIDQVAVGLRNITTLGAGVSGSSTQLGREFYRAAPSERYQSNNKLVTIMYLEAPDANPTNTKVVSATDEFNFTVEAGQGANYQQNDFIRVFTTVYQEVIVDSVATDTITLKATTPLAGTPPVDSLVQRGFGECAQFCGDASGSPNTGLMVNHADLRFFKTIDKSILVESNTNYVKAN